jgi:hypothetical protein
MYRKPEHYTDRELLEMKIQDLQTDIRCAYRDGLTDYAHQQEEQLHKLQQ